MDQLKRMMVNVRRPEVDTNNLVRERNLYREKCKEYADQIGNLMATLNQYQEEGNKSKKIAANLQIVRKELEKKASKIAQLEKSTLALQNTINHLEYRLEIANADKLDAQEQLYNMKMKKSAFDVDSNSPPLAQKYQTTDISLNTVFTEESEVYASPEIVPKDLAPFIARIERLEKDLQQKKVRSAARENLIIFLHTRQSELEDLVQQKNRLATRLEARVENMNLLLDEKDRARRQAEHKVDHYKIMIEAAIRRNGVIAAVLDDVAKEGYLPDLATLVSKKDIDCWMEQLYTQLKKYKAAQKGVTHVNSPEAIIKDQRNEIDFYVREIIYYKLDIRGYKSDIKQLKQEMQLKKDNQSIQSSDAGSRDCSSSRLVSPGLEGLKASVLSEKKKPTVRTSVV
jgi:chromosome segregation ATPase